MFLGSKPLSLVRSDEVLKHSRQGSICIYFIFIHVSPFRPLFLIQGPIFLHFFIWGSIFLHFFIQGYIYMHLLNFQIKIMEFMRGGVGGTKRRL